MFCGLGGIFIEVLKDVQSALAPVSQDEALDMIDRLKGKKILEGIRGQKGINISKICRNHHPGISVGPLQLLKLLKWTLNPSAGKQGTKLWLWMHG